MKIIEANEGQKISYSTTKTWLNVGDQIMLNLKKYEADNDVHIDITSDMAATWKPVSVFFMWHRWTFRPEPTQKKKSRTRTIPKKQKTARKQLSSAIRFRSLWTT